jgi:glycosyltransferase involved in cell wall biosynthesis
VRHVNTYDTGELRRLINSVSCLVRPTLIEGSSLVDLETLACGTPLVCTAIGTDWAVDGENALLVPMRDSGAIVEAVSRVFDDRELAEKLARNGVRVTRDRTWEREQAQWLEIVEKVMAGEL